MTESQITITVDGGQVVTGTREDVVVELRQYPHLLTLREIGEILGTSRTTVGNILRDRGISGSRDLSFLKDAKLFAEYSDKALASKFNLTVTRVSTMRKYCGFSRPRVVNLTQRQRNLILKIFGNQYVPGERFSDWLADLAENYAPGKREILLKFYVQGIPISRTERAYKHHIVRELTAVLRELGVTALIEREVIARKV